VAKETKRPSDSASGEPAPRSLVTPDVDDAVLDARAALEDALLAFLHSRLKAPGKSGLDTSDLSEGLLISVLKLIAPDGKYPIDKGRFWQLLDRHYPFGAEEGTYERLAAEIEALFTAARHEEFEAGFDSNLSLELTRLVLRYGEKALEIAADLIFADRVAPDAAAEALRCFGEMENPATYEARRRILERALECSSHIARDGAAIGLDDLCDPRSIPALETAIEREQYDLLREDMSRYSASSGSGVGIRLARPIGLAKATFRPTPWGTSTRRAIACRCGLLTTTSGSCPTWWPPWAQPATSWTTSTTSSSRSPASMAPQLRSEKPKAIRPMPKSTGIIET